MMQIIQGNFKKQALLTKVIWSDASTEYFYHKINQ